MSLTVIKKSVRKFSYESMHSFARFDESSVCAIAFVAGASATLLQANLFSMPVLVSVQLMLMIIFLIHRRKITRLAMAGQPPRLIVMIFAFMFGLSWATFQFTQQLKHQFPSELERVTTAFEGQVIGLPVTRLGNVKFQLRVTRSAETALLGQKVELSCYSCPLDIQPAQRWQFSARLKKPNGYASWGAFDFEKHLFRQQIIARGYLRLKDPQRLLASPNDSINNLRASVRNSIVSLNLASTAATATILALALGDKSLLSVAQREHLQATGVSHLMAISGLHIGLVFVFVRILFGCLLLPFARFFLFVPKQKIVLLPALLSAAAYAAMAGFAVSTQRAMLMLLIYVICRILLRNVSLFKVLLSSATIIVLLDAGSVLDAGFWLSCGAVLVIALMSNNATALSLVKLQPRLWLGMLPLTSLIFGQISVLSPVVNLVLVPLYCLVLIPATLISVVLLELGVDLLALNLFRVLAVCFDYVLIGLAYLAELPISKAYTLAWSMWHSLAFMLIILCLRAHTAIRSLAWMLMITLMFYSPFNSPAENELEIVLLDVGQGLSMVIRDSEKVLVYDTGPRYRSGFNAAEAVLLPYLRSLGVRHIDTLIISHADNDHIGGLQKVTESFSIGRILTSRTDKVPNGELCKQGQFWNWAYTRLKILSPNAETPPGSNNLSCVLQLKHGATTILITGDIEKQVERYLVSSSADLQADIVLVPHQGSKTSSTGPFLDAVQPQLGLLAAGYRNHYGHPHAQVMQRYHQREIAVDSSIDSGSVLLSVNLESWSIRRYRQHAQRFWHRQIVPN